MPTDLPMACSLDAPALSARLAEMAALGRAALRDARREGTRAELRFDDTAETRRRLARIVAAESECCPFLAFTLDHEPGGVRLAIAAPSGGEPVLDGLVEAFARA